MKKLLILIIIIGAGYLVYNNFVKGKKAVKVNASLTSSQEAVSLDAPSASPRIFGYYKGTVKNISGKDLNNVIITFIIDARESRYEINKLTPGEEVKFKTSRVMIHHSNAYHKLKSVVYNTE